MNATQRKLIARLIPSIEQALALIEPMAEELSTMQQEEQEKFDNLSDGLRQSERGQKIEEGANQLQECADKVQEAVDGLNEVASILGSIE